MLQACVEMMSDNIDGDCMDEEKIRAFESLHEKVEQVK